MDIEKILSESIEGFDKEFYELEEEYLKKFGTYPIINELSSNNISIIKEKLRDCIRNGIEYK